MSGTKYCIGIDYGTLSGRVLLVEAATGREIATSVTPYPHGVIEDKLPGTGIRLGYDWALQDPADYVRVLERSVPEVIREAGIAPADVIGIGVDFTSCTILPVKRDGTPLCKLKEFHTNPHAWVKLWKHHAAQPQANRLNETAAARGEAFLARYGGKISSEWMIPKLMEILHDAPEVYAAADRFMEAGDWLIMQLIGEEVRSSCSAGFKALWHKRTGFPDKAFFKALDPRLEDVEEKLGDRYLPIGSKAGELTAAMAERIGLAAGTAVAVFICDAPVTLPAVGVTEPGKMVLVMGTSLCHILLSDEEKPVEGICGIVEDGAIPGYYAYEAGQSAVGDIFDWFVRSCVPPEYHREAEERGMGIFPLLEEKASRLKPGQSGLLALDWWNGNRSCLMDADLTGLMVGMTLSTKPEEIYRALMEATAFGTRLIIETMKQTGIPVRELYACGGLSQKNRLLMQIYSDVTDMEIRISGSAQTGALGAAISGASAAGAERGGYASLVEASRQMANIREDAYQPIPVNAERYHRLYAEYRALHDYFGRGVNDIMKRLKKMKESEVPLHESEPVAEIR